VDERSKRSPDGAKRNPGFSRQMPHFRRTPSSAIVNLRKSETSDLRRSCGLRSLFYANGFLAVASIVIEQRT
jgi:hypothetical protein